MQQNINGVHNKKIQINFFFALLIGVLILTFLLLYQFLAPLIIAAVLAVLFHPMYERMRRQTKMPRGLAALISVIIITAITFIPIFFLGTQVFSELQNINVRETVENGLLSQANLSINKLIHAVAPNYTFDIQSIITNATTAIRNNIGTIFSSIAHFLFNFFLMFVVLFYLLKDGHRLKVALIKLSPLSDRNDTQIFARIKAAVNAVIKGSLLIGVLQGFIAFLGFTLFGVPNPALLGGLTALAALIPGIGTSLVLAPVIAYMFITGDTTHAIGLLIWGVVAVGLVDNFLGPVFIGRGVKIHPLFILLSVLGGLIVLGPIGFLLGPLIISFLFALLDIYASDFDEVKNDA